MCRATAAQIWQARRRRATTGGVALAAGGALHVLVARAEWRDALAAVLPTPPLATCAALGAAACIACWVLLSRPGARATSEQAGTLERRALLFPVLGFAAFGPIAAPLLWAPTTFDRTVAGAWSAVVATHVALAFVGWTTAERLHRSGDRALCADPTAAAHFWTWLLLGGAVVILGGALGRPVAVLGVGLGAFAFVAYLLAWRLAAERRALAGDR